LPERFTGLKPVGCRRTTAVADSAVKQSQRVLGDPERRRSMSTLQHTLQPAFRSRVALAVIAAATLAALTVILVIAAGSSTSSAPAAHPSQATIQRELEAVSGARYRIQRPGTVAQQPLTPQQQLQAVAGERYRIKTSH
jgi:hypothetical protein